MKVAVVGATGLVGSVMCEELDHILSWEYDLFLAASERSVGRKIAFRGNTLRVLSIAELLALRPDVVLFAAGSAVSLQYAEAFADAGAYVVDNSSAWRMHPNVPLVVPEINPEVLVQEAHIIANPNCSTIQMVMALAPLHKEFHLTRIHVSTYQSVSGAGMRGIQQLEQERQGRAPEHPVFPHPIDLNCIPQCDDFLENGYTKEEMKLVNETRKILQAPDLAISATAVRVPVWGGHSEAIAAEFEREVDVQQALQILRTTPGVVVQDNPDARLYPLARLAQGSASVFVGRVRQDIAVGKNALNLWVVADNIRKGAATNAVQIVEALYRRSFIS